ncbi:hypothetical protein C8R43DRAFT_1143096 [Mycena crocata]|nr:hypothetical protein C8R43DRAFT_1143096 [Mycena crocata]
MNIHTSLLSCRPDNAAPRDIESAADVGWFPLRRGDRCSAALSVLRTGAPSEQLARRLTEQRSILASELEAAQKQIASLKGRVAQSSEEKRGLSDTIELVDLVLTPWRRLPDRSLGSIRNGRESGYQEIDSDQESNCEEGSEVDSRDWEMDGEDSSEDDGRDREISGEAGSYAEASDKCSRVVLQ